SSNPGNGLLKGTTRASALMRSFGVTQIRKAFPAARALSAGDARRGNVDVSLIYFAQIGSRQDPIAVARQLNRSGEFEYVEPKYVSRLFDTPNDPGFSSQSLYFNQMNAAAGWAITKGDSNVVIADVDGGTFWRHPDLMRNLWINKAEDANHDGMFEHGAPPTGDENGLDDDGNGYVDDVIGWNFANNSNDPTGLISTPFNGQHGTATASHFGAVTNNGVGMAGSSWNCRLMPINAGAPNSDLDIQFGYDGIQYAYANGAKVINCSWGRTGTASRFEQDIIDAAAQAGALVVAAAGNDASNSDFLPEYPANYRNVLCVGAVNSGVDTKTYFTNYGLTVPVYAPGTNIWSALTDSSYGDGGSGTSYSSPLVAGLAGLVKSLHPGWTPAQIATQIRLTADSIGPVLGHGRVNFGRALQESHAGLEIVRSSLLTPEGRSVFLEGDTVVLNLTVRNVLFLDATNLSFKASAANAILQPIRPSAGPLAIAAGDSASLTPILFTVSHVDSSMGLLLRLDWTNITTNGSEHDAYAFRVNVFPAFPLWENIQSPTFLPLFTVSAVDRNVVWTAGGDGQTTPPVVLRSVDSGSTWIDATGNLSGVGLYCMNAVDSLRAWVGTGDGRIYATTDGGTSWTNQVYPPPQSPFIDGIKFFGSLNGYALGDPATGNQFVILHTTNGGSTWTHMTGEPVGLSGEAGWNNSFWWTDSLHGWFGTNKSRIWRTVNGGATWLSGPTPSSSSIAVAFADNARGLAGYSDGSLSKTTDGGATWSPLTSPTNLSVTGMAFVPGSSYAWVADPSTPFVSFDNGGTWSSQTTWPLDGSIQHVAFVDTTAGWMVSSSGEVLRYRGRSTTIVRPPGHPLPVSFELEQNFPNPFNPNTTIRFFVPTRSLVSIAIYNILGQKIADIVNQEYLRGSYDLTWKGGVSSGIYFCRLEAIPSDNPGKKFVDVKKMVYLK
ncbi:MAG TPA: S8 family serine peptidase, partial [Bacteroidota bacterium]